MTHAELTAQEILESLPEPAAAKLRTLATQRKLRMTALIKEGLLKIAEDINAAATPARPASAAPLV